MEPPIIEKLQFAEMTSVIEEEDENKSSSHTISIPSRIHAFSNKLESRLKDDNVDINKRGYRFEIANNPVSKSSLDIFKTHYNKLMN